MGMFGDRTEAAYQLAERLKKYLPENGVVLAVPRGGVPVGHIIAQEMGWPLDVVLSKKIGYPTNKEFAIGAVSLHGRYLNTEVAVSADYLEAETERIQQSLRRRYQLYLGNRQPVDIRNRTVILVDDGVATGNTLISTIQMLRRQEPAQLVIAVPVASPRAISRLSDLVEHVECVLAPPDFMAVSNYYVHFDQVTDEEVIHLLHRGR
jgi:putative phosphoribosyl transferase